MPLKTTPKCKQEERLTPTYRREAFTNTKIQNVCFHVCLKGFGRREAYESLGRTNPRHRDSVMGNLQLALP